MFILDQSESYTWPVRYEYPDAQGRYTSAEFTATFRRLPQSRLDEIGELAREDRITDEALIEEILIDWSGIKTRDNQDFECTPTNRRVLCDLPGMRTAIVLAFFESITGAARKNLKTPRDTGRVAGK